MYNRIRARIMLTSEIDPPRTGKGIYTYALMRDALGCTCNHTHVFSCDEREKAIEPIGWLGVFSRHARASPFRFRELKCGYEPSI